MRKKKSLPPSCKFGCALTFNDDNAMTRIIKFLGQEIER